MTDKEKLEIAEAAMHRACQLCANRDYLDPGIKEAAGVLIDAFARMEDE